MKHPRKYKGTKDSEKEPHPSHVTEEQVISYLSSISQPESIRQIAHGMELQHHGRRFLPRIIQYLKGRGDVEEIRGGQYRLAESKNSSRAAAKAKKPAAAESHKPAHAGSGSVTGAGAAHRSADPNLVSGRIVAHRDGYGFLVPDKPIPRVEGDLFIGRDAMADAMHGDRVLARVERRKADGRAEGRIVQIARARESDGRRAFPLRSAWKRCAAVRHANSTRGCDSAGRRIDSGVARESRRGCRRQARWRAIAECGCRSWMAPW